MISVRFAEMKQSGATVFDRIPNSAKWNEVEKALLPYTKLQSEIKSSLQISSYINQATLWVSSLWIFLRSSLDLFTSQSLIDLTCVPLFCWAHTLPRCVLISSSRVEETRAIKASRDCSGSCTQFDCLGFIHCLVLYHLYPLSFISVASLWHLLNTA